MSVRLIPVGLVLVLIACERIPEQRTGDPPMCAPDVPAVVTGYTDADAPIPAHFLSSPEGTVAFSDRTPPDRRTTNWGAMLGRVLFYDVRLSEDDRVACASCHHQALGFGDTLPRSPGIRGRLSHRRTLALANARFNAYGRYFWDERAPSLEAQVLMPIADTLEMGLSLDSMEVRLRRTDFYPALFTAAFGSPEITRDRVASALAQFVRTLVSSGSAADGIFATGGAPDTTRVPPQVLEGLRLFDAVGCHNCHRTIAYFADKGSNTGLDSIPVDTGSGAGSFKPSSLRNVAVHPPYMHDGRFRTLEDVVAFYDHGVRNSPDLDPRLRSTDGTPRRLGLTAGQQEAIVAFLRALTDSNFLRAERFADPFPCQPSRIRPSATQRSGAR